MGVSWKNLFFAGLGFEIDCFYLSTVLNEYSLEDAYNVILGKNPLGNS